MRSIISPYNNRCGFRRTPSTVCVNCHFVKWARNETATTLTALFVGWRVVSRIMHLNWSSQRVILMVCACSHRKVKTHLNGESSRTGHQSRRFNGCLCTVYLPATPFCSPIILRIGLLVLMAFHAVVREHRWGTHRFSVFFLPLALFRYRCVSFGLFHFWKSNCKCKRCCVTSFIRSIFFVRCRCIAL